MNPDLSRLQPYPFQRLSALLTEVAAPQGVEPIALSIGEPKHPAPELVTETLRAALGGLSSYPTTRGQSSLREAIAQWLIWRFHLPTEGIDPDEHVLPVNGTREALFAIAQCLVERARGSTIIMPNPFYQIYEGAALLAGAEPHYVNSDPGHGIAQAIDQVSPAEWERCALLYICNPDNPTGAVLDEAHLVHLIELAERFDFVIAADECYSEIYLDEANPPPGLLGAATRAGHNDYRRCLVFHSLSKRSNVPGLRSGFVAGDPRLIDAFLRYRTYHGCAMPPHHQAASTAAWSDEGHVRENRALYREKFDAVIDILAPVLDVQRPGGGFYLWPETPVDDTVFARRLYAEQGVAVLPGRFLSRATHDVDPGEGRVRMALVAPLDECVEAARRIRAFVPTL